MIVRAVFPLMRVLVLLRIVCVGMLVRMFMLVDVVVLVSVRRLVVGVLMCMGMSVFVLMLVAMIVSTFHWVSSLFSVWRMANSDKSILADRQQREQRKPCPARHNRNRKPSDTARPGAR